MGIKHILGDGNLRNVIMQAKTLYDSGVKTKEELVQMVADIIEPYKESDYYDALYGFMIQDEPDASKFEVLEFGREIFEEAAPGLMFYVNLFPVIATGAQLSGTSEPITIVKNRTTYTLKGSASKTHLLAQISFLNGEAAMIPNGNWIEKESLSSMTDEVRMMKTPRMEGALTDNDGNYISYNYSGQPDYMFIPAKASNKEGAKLFLAYMCKDEVLKLYTNYTGTPRPFDYDVSECTTSDFIKSCLEVWSNSVTWFENSSSELWTANKITKFNLGSPYTMLLSNSETMSAIGWCAQEYTNIKNSWDTL